ncbi:hypothetical protein [Clostridium polynesiense]|uniref:hypothetical protein n=1 Tax=Clostridium polynesiense TaxID=1325933 RepID=UPI000A7559A3|nr:hypothetical protein [Clostridium polynesiense]
MYTMLFLYPICALILYVNSITILKKIKKDEPTWENTLTSCICILVLIFISFYLRMM